MILPYVWPYIWFYSSILAATFQAFRNATQKSLKGKIDTISISWSRVLFTLPIVLIIGFALPKYYQMNFWEVSGQYSHFLFYCFIGGLLQIAGTILLVELFSHRNFLVGVTYMKTEVLQTAILGALFFGESINMLSVVAITIATFGLIFLTDFSLVKNYKSFLKALSNKSAIIGLASGFSFALCAFFFKKAILLATFDTKLANVIIVLIYTNIFQNLIFLFYQKLRGKLKQSIKAIFRYWRPCMLVGIFSICGTICWFLAFSLQIVAYVKLVGQIEILLSFLISHGFFQEKTTKLELTGILLIMTGVILIILI